MIESFGSLIKKNYICDVSVEKVETLKMSQEQIVPNSLPDTQTPASQMKFDDNKDVWGKLTPRRAYFNTLELSDDKYTLGRQETCSICISSRNMPQNLIGIVSKVHFLISRDDSLVPYIKDLSRNGTFLNGGLIGKGNSSTLCTGDIIAIGNPKVEVYNFRDESYSGTEYGLKYKETRFLGRGAFGEVYLVFSKSTCQRFAVKKVPKTRITYYGTIKNYDEKISNEVKILRALKHPCVINLEEIINTPEQVYIILEYMEGGELRNRILKKRRLSENISKLFFYQMVLALQYLHKKGIIHRDLKPENILLASNDDVTLLKISDFGLSKIIDNDTVLKSLCGTPTFVAPEILHSNGKGAYSSQVDIWSLGVILYCCLCGNVPFIYQTDEMKMLYYQIISGSYTIPEEIQACISTECVNMINRTLLTDPEKRIKIDEIFRHEWLTDVKVQNTFKKLLIESQNKC